MKFTLLTACLLVSASFATAQQPARKPSAKAKLMNTMSAVVGGGDDCNSATPIAGAGSFNFDNSAATTGAEGQNEYICYDFGSSAVDNDVWFSYTAGATGTAIVDTCNTTSTDTKIGAYPGGGCPASGSALACNDDTCALQSQISFSITAGTSYMIQVGTFPGSVGGTGTLNINEGGGGGGGANDDCNSPDAISGAGSFAFDNSFATTGAEGQNEYICYDFGSSAVDNDVWFNWTATVTEQVTVQTCGGTSTDTKVGAYPGGACPGVGSAIACNDDTCGLQSSISFAANAGSSYMLQIGTFPGAPGGSGTFSVSGVAPPAGNDDCNTPSAIAGQGTFNYDSSSATTGAEGQNEYLCYDFGSSTVDNDLWFDWTSDFTGNCVVSSCNLVSMDTKLAAYDGNGCPSAAALACNDDFTGCASFTSEINFAVTTGTTYILQCGNFPGALGGPGIIDISSQAPPTPHPQDECSGALAIAGSGTHNFDTSGASQGSSGSTTGTDGQNETLCYAFGTSAVNNDIWFTWTSDGTGLADLTLCNGGASLDTKVAVWPNACPPAAGSILACNDDVCGLQSELQFNATTGTTYLIQFGSFSVADHGSGTFDITVVGAPGGPCTVFCSGDGSGSVACPCGNNASPGEGCANGSGVGATLTCSGDASVSADTLVLESTQLLPNQPCLFFQGNNAINGGDGVTFGDGLRCAGGGVIRLQVRFPDGAGNAATTLSVSVKGGCAAGDLKRYQNWYRDPASSSCGSLFNLTNGVEVTWNA
jgi:hypothetical protein